MDNIKLLRKPTELEIKLIVFYMHPNKFPGLDGFPTSFYKKKWNFLMEDVTKVVIQFFESKYLFKELNATFITLIPKKEAPESPADYKPISL